MRNLKRALSLTLASVMLLGMMVVGSSAAAGYDDVKDTDNVEAIEVLQAVEVMVGDDRGFGPDRPVTRNEMAVVMGKLLNLDYNYYVSTCPFTDVAEWAKGWVGACAANGIVSGRGNNIYDGEATVTAIEAASMMMRALGYFKNIEDYADGFQVVTVRQGSQIGIFNGVGTDATTAMTRNQVAQMALNALRSNMVTFTGTPGIEVNGVKVGYKAEYTERTSPEAKYNTIADLATTIQNDNGQYYIQLGEELYDGDLRLNDNATDDFGRPSRYWEYDGKAIGTYMKKELIREEYTDKVTGKMLYELLTKDVVESIKRGRDGDYTLSIAIDGEEREAMLKNKGDNGAGQNAQDFYFDIGKIVRGNTDGVGGTGKGVLTQVFVNTNKKHVDIAIINTYLAKADADYASRQDKVTFTVYAVENISTTPKVLVKNTNLTAVGSKAITTPLEASGEDFNVQDVKEDDIYLVTVAQGEIQTLTKPEVLAETEIDAFKKTSNVTVAGQKYDYANTAKYNDEVLDNYTGNGATNLKDKTYNVYLDKYGYLIGVEEVEAVSNYVFITGYDGNYSNLANKVADMGAIFTDGTMKTIKVKTKDSSDELFNRNDSQGNPTGKKNAEDNNVEYHPAIINVWCTYTVNDNDEYTLTIVDGSGKQKANQSVENVTGANKMTIDEKRVQVKGADGNYVFGNDKTVYINTELETINVATGVTANIIDDVASITTGARNVSLEVSNKTISPTDNNYKPINEVYTLYKVSGRDIIAMITLDAEDSGSNAVYAYVTSDNVTEEAYSKADDKYTWSREVVIDGVKTKVNYVGDALKKIGPHPSDNATIDDYLVQGHWYELKMDANNNVRKAKALTFVNSGDKYVKTVEGVVATWNASKDVDILWADKYDVNGANAITKLTYDNGTLWVNDAKTTGITVDDNVKVVICNANDKGSSRFDSVVDGYTGKNSVQSALTDLNHNFTGYVSALYSGGKAKVIILECTAGKDGYNGGNNQGNNNVNVTGVKAAIHGADTFSGTQGLDIGYVGAANKPTTIAELTAIVKAWAVENGYAGASDIPSVSGTVYTWQILNAFGASPMSVKVDTNSTTGGSNGGIVEGFRVHFVDADGTGAGVGTDGTTSNGWEILSLADAANNHKYVAGTGMYVTTPNTTTRWIWAKAPGATVRTWSTTKTIATTNTFNDAGKDASVLINGHDYDVCIAGAAAKVNIGTTAYYGAAGGQLNTLKRGTDGAAYVNAAGTGAYKVSTSSAAHTAYASVTVADGDTWMDGMVKITSAANAITKVDGKDKTTDGVALDCVPANSAVELTLTDDTKVIGVDADSKQLGVYEPNATSYKINIANTGVKNITLSKALTVTLNDLAGGIDGVTLVWKDASGKKLEGATVDVAANAKITATVTLAKSADGFVTGTTGTETKVTFAGTADAKSLAAKSAGADFGAFAPGSGAKTSEVFTFTVDETIATDKDVVIEATFTILDSDALTITFARGTTA